jgi:tetratricopeptide (TPR) repeat protein
VFTNLRRRSVLIIALIILTIPSIWLIRHIIFLRYQSLGGKYLQNYLDQTNPTSHGDFFCDYQFAVGRNEPESIQLSLEYFTKANQLNSEDPYLNLQLGRVYCLLDDLDLAQKLLLAYTLARPENPLGHLELGFLYERICISSQNADSADQLAIKNCAAQVFRSKIVEAWKAAGVSAQNFLNRGDEKSDSILSERFIWFNRAVILDPDNEWTWNRIGMACRDIDRMKIENCQLFAARNDGNLIPNSNFQFGLLGWGMASNPTYQVGTRTECDSSEQYTCGTINVPIITSEYTVDFNQCLTLKTGKNFKFSAWIKVNAPPDSVWRPVYIQGVVDGAPRGIWPGTQQGSMDWILWETQFLAPDYEDHLACFYPIRLNGAGEALFYRPTILEVDTPK